MPGDEMPGDESAELTRAAERERQGLEWVMTTGFAEIEARFEHLRLDQVVVLDLRVDRGVEVKAADAETVVAAAARHKRKPLNKLVRHFESLGFEKSYASQRLKDIFGLEQMQGLPLFVVCVGDTTNVRHPDLEHSFTATTVQAALRRRENIYAAALRANDHQGNEGAEDAADNYRSRNKCGHCGRPCGTLCCSACGQVRYCDRRCQKAHWPSHKGPCARRRAAVARIDELRKQMGCMTTGHDTIKRMSDEGVDAMMTPEESDRFMKCSEDFRKDFVTPGFLADLVFELRGKKLISWPCGDDGATTRRKGLNWERRISVHVDHNDYLDLLQRFAAGGSDGWKTFNPSFIIIDDTEIPDLAPPPRGPLRRVGPSGRRGLDPRPEPRRAE